VAACLDPGRLRVLRPALRARGLDINMAMRKKHTPEQVVRELATADREPPCRETYTTWTAVAPRLGLFTVLTYGQIRNFVGFAGSIMLLPRQLRGRMDDRRPAWPRAPRGWTQVRQSIRGPEGALLRIELPAERQSGPDLGRWPGGYHVDLRDAVVQRRHNPGPQQEII
jgi:hypothetical protein